MLIFRDDVKEKRSTLNGNKKRDSKKQIIEDKAATEVAADEQLEEEEEEVVEEGEEEEEEEVVEEGEATVAVAAVNKDSDDIWGTDTDGSDNESEKAARAIISKPLIFDLTDQTIFESITIKDSDATYCNFSTVYGPDSLAMADLPRLYLDIEFNERLMGIAMSNLIETSVRAGDYLYICSSRWNDPEITKTELTRLVNLQFFKKKCIFLIVHSNHHWFSIQLVNLDSLLSTNHRSPFMVIVDSLNTKGASKFLAPAKRYCSFVYIIY